MNYLLQALITKLQGEVEVAKANIMVYTRNPSGIGEHPGIIEAIEAEVSKIAEANDKLETVQKHFKNT